MASVLISSKVSMIGEAARATVGATASEAFADDALNADNMIF